MCLGLAPRALTRGRLSCARQQRSALIVVLGQADEGTLVLGAPRPVRVRARLHARVSKWLKGGTGWVPRGGGDDARLPCVRLLRLHPRLVLDGLELLAGARGFGELGVLGGSALGLEQQGLAGGGETALGLEVGGWTLVSTWGSGGDARL